MGIDSFWLQLTIIANTDLGQWLPVSPFQRFIASWEGLNNIKPYLGYVNWFLPIGQCLSFLGGWLIAIGIFYSIMAFLRYMSVID